MVEPIIICNFALNNYFMNVNVVDENLMITNPVRFARSKRDLKIGAKAYFNSAGWRIKAVVKEIITKRTFQGFCIYVVGEIDHLKYNGLEMTDKELEKFNKEK